jgi:hypothetical protein
MTKRNDMTVFDMFDRWGVFWEEWGYIVLVSGALIVILGGALVNTLTGGKGSYIYPSAKMLKKMKKELFLMHDLHRRHRTHTRRDYPFSPETYPRRPPAAPTMSQGERVCKEYLERVFERPFEKSRPPFLHNAVTQDVLEIDLYNADLRLGVEYNGRQHYEFVPYFHTTRDKFQTQRYRDHMKKELCAKNNVMLIVVPYTVPLKNIPSFLENELRQRGLFPQSPMMSSGP